MSSKIKLAIDASRSSDLFQKTGVELVSDELLKNINSYNLQPTTYNLVYYTPKLISNLPKDKQKILNWPPLYLWTQIRLAWELFKNPPEKIFTPASKIPLLFLLFNSKTNKYTIIHDVAFLNSSKLYSPIKKFYLNFDLKLTLKKCTKIFVPTLAVKNDILKYFPKINPEKIIPIHHGYTPFCHSDRPLGLLGVEESLKLQKHKKQILYIGRIEEKKNIENLIKAFEIFNKKHSEYKLILAGKINKQYFNNLNSKFQIPNSVEFLDYISKDEKIQLLQNSSCLLLISKDEGFGFPILEAWNFKLPILVSNIPVLKEVGGDACLYTNPNSISEITENLEKITQDENLQNELIQKGSQRLKIFNWQTTAKKYLQEILEK